MHIFRNFATQVCGFNPYVRHVPLINDFKIFSWFSETIQIQRICLLTCISVFTNTKFGIAKGQSISRLPHINFECYWMVSHIITFVLIGSRSYKLFEVYTNCFYDNKYPYIYSLTGTINLLNLFCRLNGNRYY